MPAPGSLDGATLYIDKLVAYQTVSTSYARREEPALCEWPLTKGDSGSTKRAESEPYSSADKEPPSTNTQASPEQSPRTGQPTPPTAEASCRCLLCPKTCKDMSGLSTHYDRVHQATLKEPFACPECNGHTIHSWNDWVAHIEIHHGLYNAPRRRSTADIKCLLCRGTFASISGLSRYTTRCHKQDFGTPFPYPECPEHSVDQSPLIGSLSDWCSHMSLSYGGTEYAPRPSSGTKYRCLLCERKVINEMNHYARSHSQAFDEPFYCPECIRLGTDAAPLLTGRDAWQLHCAAKHGKATLVFGIQKYTRCLFCNKYFGKVSDHFTKHHVQALPFSCPECKRLGEADADQRVIQDRDGWVLHCAADHGDIAAALVSQTVNTQTRRKRKQEDDLAWAKRVKQDDGR